ncbi:MAG: STAS/SEC14 domain-containing protein [Bacteroidetes bacterium]|nr:STAS/SEC14 domain-containing protein [Bacteroidota bacterium]
MNYSIDLDHSQKLVKYRHTGNIKAPEIEQAWGDFLGMKEFTEMKYNLLSDYRNSKFDIPLDYMPQIVEFYRPISHIVKSKRQALIIDDNYSMAASILFVEKMFTEIGFIIQVFTTEEAAVKWLAGPQREGI